MAENFGFEYMYATNKEEFLSHIDKFIDDSDNMKPIIFEIFTNSEDESMALKQVRNLKTNFKGAIK